MSSERRAALIGLVAEITGRPVDLIDLETAHGVAFARAMGGTELLCDDVTTRQRLIVRLLREEDDRRTSALAARAGRAALFE